MRSGHHGLCMDPKAIVLLVICITALSVAGCTRYSPPGPAGTTTVPVSPSPIIPAVTISPAGPSECTSAADCVPAECCHASTCIPETQKKVCNLMCTANCAGPLDCGAGSCGCVKGKCAVISSSSGSPAPGLPAAMTINATPKRYSPVMSSTPGIGLEPVITGFRTENASFTWRATYGRFLSWNSPDFTIHELGDSVTNHGEKIFWTFIDRPASTATPVTITVTATDTASGRLLGSSAVTLEWADNYFVTVRDSQ